MKHRIAPSSMPTAVAACLTIAPLAAASSDIAAEDMLVIEEHDCRVVVPPRGGDPSEHLAPGCPDESVIDVLWAFTPAALGVAGGDRAALFAAIELATEDCNETFANTGLPFSVRTVGLVAVDYDESGDHLAHFQHTTDGVMDEIHPLRDVVAADICALITETGTCGVAYVAPHNAAWGFQANTAWCLINLAPFRHELGHNLGSQHFFTDTYGYLSYASGHRFTPDGGSEIGTCMGGNDITHYSNPNVLYGGQPTGVPIGPDEEADNYTAFLQTAPMVADFRCSDDTCAGDINRDLSVDFEDVLVLLSQWGECGACAADLDGNGLVEFEDLVILLGAWGPCE